MTTTTLPDYMTTCTECGGTGRDDTRRRDNCLCCGMTGAHKIGVDDNQCDPERHNPQP